MNTSKKKLSPPWKWNWIKATAGLIAMITVGISMVIFVILGIIGYPYYLVKKYIKRKLK